jgi:ABC-type transport system involved in multi-copper enzyme maturation permease subunit
MSGVRNHFPGLGPVFAFEWLCASRRWQGYAMRSLFVLLLLAALLVIWASKRDVRSASRIRDMAQFGQGFYVALIGTQLTLVLLAAPAATAGAICLDRARGTLTHLLMTDLSDGEIVLGKLAARLVPILGLVGCTLPVMAILTLLGGVDPEALFGAFVVTLGIAVLGCSLALVFSLWATRTHEALLGIYAIWGLWLLCNPMIRTLNRSLGWTLHELPRTADPYLLSFAPYYAPGSVDWRNYLGFLSVTWALSALLPLLAILRLRPVTSRENVRGSRHRPSRFANAVRVVERQLDPFGRLWGPSLDVNPVLWREWHRSRPSRGGRIVAALFVAVAMVFSALALVSRTAMIEAWVNGLQVSVGLLLLRVTAATSLAEERVRGSLDTLMATPLSTLQIVIGKWLGTFRRSASLAILPVLVIVGGAGPMGGRVLLALLTIAFVLTAGAAITSLGLAMATWSPRLGRAVGLTVTIYVLIAVGWMFLMMMLISGPPSAEGPMMGSPFFWVGELTFELVSRGLRVDHIVWAIIWTIAYSVVAVALLAATLATFNRCLGRVAIGSRPRIRRESKAEEPVLLEEVAGESLLVVRASPIDELF